MAYDEPTPVTAEWIPVQGALHNVFAALAKSGAGLSLVQGGVDLENRPLYVVRAEHNGRLLPGKQGFHLPGAHIPYSGETIIRSYEVLVGTEGDYEWRPQRGNLDTSRLDHFVPVIGSHGQTMPIQYIARARIPGGTVHCGRVQEQGIAQVSFGGKELYIQEYDILVFSASNKRAASQLNAIDERTAKLESLVHSLYNNLDGVTSGVSEAANNNVAMITDVRRGMLTQDQRLYRLEQLVAETLTKVSNLEALLVVRRVENNPATQACTDGDALASPPPRGGSMIGFDPTSEAASGRGYFA